MFNKKRHSKEQFTLRWQLKFLAMILFTACLFILKITTGHMTNSMALVADSFHMITDFAALTIGYMALRLANSKTGSKFADHRKFTFGWVRAEVLGGLINTVFLLALCFSVLVTALKRFVQPEVISRPKPVLLVGVVSLVVNFLGLLLFRTSRENMWKLCRKCCRSHNSDNCSEEISLMPEEMVEDTMNNGVRHRKMKTKMKTRNKEPTWESEYQTPHSLNIRGVYLHILEHFLASIIVIVSTVIVIFYKDKSWTAYVDPGFTLLVVCTILYSTIPLFRETLILFMQSVPANIKVKDLEERLIKQVPKVLSVHEFHVWQLGGGDQVVASAHILFKELVDFEDSVNKIKDFFHEEGIANLTFQPEFLPADSSEDEDTLNELDNFSTSKCYFRCADGKDCSPLTCCAVHDGDDTQTETESTDIASTYSPEINSLLNDGEI